MNELRKTKYFIIYGIMFLFASILIINLAKLQLFDPYYSKKANATTLNQNTIYPSRGLFYDRHGKLMVINYPAYDISVIYKNIPKNMDTAKFCQLLNISKEKFIENLTVDWSSGKYSKSLPFVFLKNVSSSTFLRFQELMYQFPGFSATLRAVREYPISVGSNFLGYTSEVTKEEIESSEGIYKIGDYCGSAGLEKEYENDIRGEKGVRFVMKDNLGREVGPYNFGKLDKEAKSGNDLIFSIDLELQKYGEELMENKLGSIVAIEPSTGEILCLVSAPGFNPNLLSVHPERGKAYAYLMLDSLKPLFDRSAAAMYPPGSIFKPVMALMALQENVITPFTAHPCSGPGNNKNTSITCHNHPSPYKLSVALQHSCNGYFAEVFKDFINKEGYEKPKIGMDLFVKYLQEFGLGQSLLSDVYSEKSGFIPTSEYYTRIYKTDRWRATYIKSLGIGQGELQLTSLQMANLAAIIGNRGYYVIPHLLKQIGDGHLSIPEKFRYRHKLNIDAAHFEPVIEGMEMAVSAGTATLAKNDDLSICGKTGTSENPHGEDHSVFFAFAPKFNPKIAISVYVENAGKGGLVAAPIASLMIEKYLKGKVERKDLEEKMKKKNLIEKKAS